MEKCKLHWGTKLFSINDFFSTTALNSRSAGCFFYNQIRAARAALSFLPPTIRLFPPTILFLRIMNEMNKDSPLVDANYVNVAKREVKIECTTMNGEINNARKGYIEIKKEYTSKANNNVKSIIKNKHEQRIIQKKCDNKAGDEKERIKSCKLTEWIEDSYRVISEDDEDDERILIVELPEDEGNNEEADNGWRPDSH